MHVVYAIVYSADLNGAAILHTPTPFRGAELLGRRELIEQGLHLMSTRGLVTASWDDDITYTTGEASRFMTSSLTSDYLRKLEAQCDWVELGELMEEQGAAGLAEGQIAQLVEDPLRPTSSRSNALFGKASDFARFHSRQGFQALFSTLVRQSGANNKLHLVFIKNKAPQAFGGHLRGQLEFSTLMSSFRL